MTLWLWKMRQADEFIDGRTVQAVSCVGGRDTGGRRVRKAWGRLGRCTDALAELEKQRSSFPGLGE